MSRLSFGPPVKDKSHYPTWGEASLVFEGVVVPSTSEMGYLVTKSGDKFRVHITETVIAKFLTAITVSEFLNELEGGDIVSTNVSTDELITIGQECDIYKNDDYELVFAVTVEFDQRNWNKPWSCGEVVALMQQVASELPDIYEVNEAFDEGSEYRAHVLFKFRDTSRALLKEIEMNKRLTLLFVQEVEKLLLESLNENKLVIPFNFPLEIRTSCEQYLIYFAQFLEDVGVTATTDINHQDGDARQVLFSVVPSDGKKALDKVRQALELYLDLGQVPNMNPNFSASIEIQRMQSQVLHFQSQLVLAQAVIQQKDAAIAWKDALIAQIQARAIFEEAQKAPSKKEEDRKIALFKGTVHLKRYDAKFVDVDLPAIYDLLAKWFADEDSTGDLASYFKQNGLELPQSSTPALPPASDGE